MDKNRFETQKHVVNLDPTVHNIQSFFTVEDLKWLIEKVEEQQKKLESIREVYPELFI